MTDIRKWLFVSEIVDEIHVIFSTIHWRNQFFLCNWFMNWFFRNYAKENHGFMWKIKKNIHGRIAWLWKMLRRCVWGGEIPHFLFLFSMQFMQSCMLFQTLTENFSRIRERKHLHGNIYMSEFLDWFGFFKIFWTESLLRPQLCILLISKKFNFINYRYIPSFM